MAATVQTILKPTRAKGLDTSGNNNHAQIYSGRALEFDGITDYLHIGAETTFSTGACTISCWVNIANYASSVADHLVDSDATSSFSNVGFDTSGHLAVYDYGGGAWRDSTSILQKNTWYRVVYSYDGSGTLTFYINGVADGTGVIDTSGDNDDCIVEYIGKRHNNTRYFDGMMSDFQIWDAAWTAADAEYDYLNPEQLALNRGGTSLTNSNLKLWYPMNEGHRGNQSYILDASNTGLGDEMIAISDLKGYTSAPAGWSVDELGAEDSVTWGANGVRFYQVSSEARSLRYTANVVEGKAYRLVVVVSDYSGNRTLKIDNSATYSAITVDSVGTHTFNFVAKADQATFINLYRGNGTTVDITIESVSLIPINNKHNATTAFYGDNTIPTVHDYNMGGSNNWDAYGTGTTESVTGGKLRVTTTTANTTQGAELPVANAGTPVVGRTYRIRAKLKRVSGLDPAEQIVFYYGGAQGNITTVGGGGTTNRITDSEVEYETTVTATSASGNLLIVNWSTTTALVFEIDDVEIKEVGVATGWTDADKELDIPQTGLQSYNRLGWFDGVERLQSGSNITPGDHTSISLWFFRNKGTSSETMALIEAGDYADENFYIYHRGDAIRILTYNEDDTTTAQTHSISATINNGQWYHLGVYIPAADGGTITAYLNGQSIGTSTMSHPMKKAAYAWYVGYAGGLDHEYAEGCITEISYFNDQLTASEFEELYNNGLALNALKHSQAANLVHYWRNDGLTTWTDLKGSNNLTGSMTQSMLITAGVDSSRDSQGFLMNSQRTTNCVNSLNEGSGASSGMVEGIVVHDSDTLDLTGSFTLSGWFKFKDLDQSYNLFNKKSTWNGEGYGLYRNTNGNMYMEYAKDSSAKQLGRSFTPTLGVWYFVFCTHEASGNDVRGYAAVTDTSFTSSSSSGALANVGTNDLELTIGVGIGGNDDNSNIQFSGQIDDVLIYNGKALSTNELMRNFKAGKRSHK